MANDIIARGLAASGLKEGKLANSRLDSLPKGIVYKGTVNYYADLPENAEVGDTYTVKYRGTEGTAADGREFAWGLDTETGEYTWVELGGGINPATVVEVGESGQTAPDANLQVGGIFFERG